MVITVNVVPSRARSKPTACTLVLTANLFSRYSVFLTFGVVQVKVELAGSRIYHAVCVLTIMMSILSCCCTVHVM